MTRAYADRLIHDTAKGRHFVKDRQPCVVKTGLPANDTHDWEPAA